MHHQRFLQIRHRWFHLRCRLVSRNFKLLLLLPNLIWRAQILRRIGYKHIVRLRITPRHTISYIKQLWMAIEDLKISV